jgi:dTDP-4-dehydrorhamnose reductase
MRVLITGGAGMLAYDLHTVLLNQGCEVISCSRADLDSTDPTSVKSALSLHHPDIVINCAAYTAVDQAQSVGSQECYRINTLGTAVLAKSCFDS